jgi:hypothetical protein
LRLEWASKEINASAKTSGVFLRRRKNAEQPAFVSGHDFTTYGKPRIFEGAQLQLCRQNRWISPALAAEGWFRERTFSQSI